MRILIYFFKWLELLGLAIFIGGMIILGAVVAPTVFGMLLPMSTGGEVMSTLFIRFNSVVAYICLGLIVVGFLGKLALGAGGRKLKYIEGLTLLMMLVIVIYVGSFLTPRMDQLRHMRIQDPNNHQAVEQFGAGHRLSQKLFSMNLLLGLVVLYLNAMDVAKRQK
jgi:uncharacterized membrane protein